MIEREVLFNQHALLLEKHPEPDDAIIELLSATVWGTPGGTLFQHLDTPDKIKLLQHPCFFSLSKKNLLLACMVMCKRVADFKGEPTDAFYIRYNVFQEQLRNRIVTTRHKKNPSDQRSGSLVRETMLSVLENPQGLFDPSSTNAKGIVYGYVDSSNQRSIRMMEKFGFTSIREFTTVAFSRFFPKISSRFGQASTENYPLVLQAIQKFYQQYSLFFTDNVMLSNFYFLTNDAGKIVAGVQATPATWAVKALPGPMGKITMTVLPFLPFISRLFNPKRFYFALFEYGFWEPGYEAEFFQLLESALAKLRLFSGLMWIDTESELYQTLKKSGKLGFLDKMQEVSPVKVVAKFSGHTPEEMLQYKSSPVFISALDLS